MNLRNIVAKLLTPYKDETIKAFLTGMFIFGLSIGLYTAVLNNFLHEELGITRLQRGLLEFPRELPGLLLFLTLAVLHKFSELKIMKLAFWLGMTGLIGLALFGSSRIVAIIMIVFWSWGEHLLMPVRSSIAIHAAKPGNEGLAMGGVRSAGAVGKVFGHYLVLPLFVLFPLIFGKDSGFNPYRFTFAAAGIILVSAIFLSSRLKNWDRPVKRNRIYFRAKCIKYYILEVFFGARKQVFITFAPYVLILNYGARTELIATLHGIWALANIFVAPLVGKIMDRVGYKKLIVIDTVVLVILCLVYGFAHRLFPQEIAFVLVAGVFVLDAILFTVGMARTMYVKTISDSQEEVTSTLSTGLSINHLISIVIAMVGGALWEVLGIETLFGVAAFFGLGSFIFSLTLPRAGMERK